LIGADRILHTRVATLQGVYDWLNKDTGCRLQNLNRRFGFEQPVCRVCDVCRRKPTRVLAARAEIVVQKTNHSINQAMRVLKMLAEKCIVCNRSTCNGETCMDRKSCYRCGQSHYQKDCKDIKTAGVVLKQKACSACYDFVGRRDFEMHDSKTCPLKRRLRRVVFDRYNPSEGSFAPFLNNIYGNLDSFYSFVAALEPGKRK
jgi:superfamily II DNA helicase RecQ